MKVSVFAVLLVIAGTYALPQQNFEARNQQVIDRIKAIIDCISYRIVRADLDPLEIKDASFEYKNNPDIFEIEAVIDSLTFTGASNIVLNSISINPVFQTLELEVYLPELSLTVVNTAVDVSILGNAVSAKFAGSIVINRLGLAARVNYSHGIVSGIRVEGITVRAGLDSIQSDVSVEVNGQDHTFGVNFFLNFTLPATLREYHNEINHALENIIMTILQHLS